MKARAGTDRLVVVPGLEVQRATVGGRDGRRVVLATANDRWVRGEREFPGRFHRSQGMRGAAAVVVLPGERARSDDSRERRQGPQRGPHPPSALIASTSAVPSPAIMQTAFQLP